MARALVLVLALAVAVVGVAASSECSCEREIAAVAELRAQLSELQRSASEQQEALLAHIEQLEAEFYSKPGADAPQHHAVAHHGRSLASAADGASLVFGSQNGKIKFASGTEVWESEAGQLHTSGGLVVENDLVVRGALSSDGSNLNLGVAMTASSNVATGDVVSLVADGGVASGFGLQISAPLTSMSAEAENGIIVHMSGDVVTIVYQDAAGLGYASYYDTGSSAAAAPVAFGNGQALSDVSASHVSDTQLAVCYGAADTASARCSVGQYIGAIEFGTELDVPDSSTFRGGAVSGLRDATDRVVFVFSREAVVGDISSEAMRAQVLSVSGKTITPVGTPRVLLQSSMGDHIAVISLTSSKLLVTYRVPRESNAEVRELYFRESDAINIQARSRFSVVDNGGETRHMSIDRLSDDRALVTFRDVNNDNAVNAVVFFTDGELVKTGSPAVIDSGTSVATLWTSVAAVSSSRAAVSFVDAKGFASIQDVGVFGNNIVSGRSQKPFRTSTNPAATLSIARISDTKAISFARESVTTGTPPGAAVMRNTVYGGPTIMGFAKAEATSGSSVTVVLQGAVDGYSGLSAGAPYYARYDGGVGNAPDEVGGVSSVLVGKALTPSIMLSVIGADGEQNAADIAAVNKDLAKLDENLAGLLSQFSGVTSRVDAIEATFKDTHYMRSDLPIYRWAQWSSFSQAHGQWYAGNNADMFGGVHPSNWGDGNQRAVHLSANKDILRTLFSRRGYGGWNANVCSEEWYSYSSTNSKHCGVLFRIRNTKDVDVSWRLYFYRTNYGGWSERSGVAINGAEAWESGSGDCGSHCTADVTVTVPANRISTVFVITASSSQSGTRSNFLAFYNNCLQLPDGLEYVDDMDTATGGWEA